jgi:HKD family nuclease
MAKKQFILQGFTARTHTDAVRKLFDVPNIEAVLLSVAFITESGVEKIEANLKGHAAKLTIFAGIRNDITSHQGLARLHGTGGTLYTVDTGSRTVIFHPKLFMVRGKQNAALVLGSANLTLGGLNNNIEAGLMLNFDLADPADKAVVDEIEAELLALPMEYPQHVVKIGGMALLDEMLDSGRLVDEMAIPPPRPTTSAGGAGASDTLPRIKLRASTSLTRAPVQASVRQNRAWSDGSFAISASTR